MALKALKPRLTPVSTIAVRTINQNQDGVRAAVMNGRSSDGLY